MKHQNQMNTTVRKRTKHYPNQADHNPALQKIMDTAMMFACCIGSVSVMSAIMTIF